MALSGQLSAAAGQHNTLIFSWSAVQSIPDNTSRLYWQLMLTADAAGRLLSLRKHTWMISVAGQEFAGTAAIQVPAGGSLRLASGSVLCRHDDGGTGEFFVRFSQDLGDTLGIVSGTGIARCDSIPRQSTALPETDTITLGTPVNIQISGAHGDFLHTLACRFRGQTYPIGENIAGSCQWTPDKTLAHHMLREVSAEAAILCTTWLDGQQVGTVTQTPVTLTVPATMKPILHAAWSDASGAYETVGALVTGVSRLEISHTAVGSYGSRVNDVKIWLGSEEYTGGVLRKNGLQSLSVVATDSRGRTAQEKFALTVKLYSKPKVELAASRCDADGTSDDTGEYARITLTGAVSDLDGNNTAALTLSWGSQSEVISPGTGSFRLERIVSAPSTQVLPITVRLEDKLLTVTRDMTLSTGYATLDLLAGGKGISFGTSATREGFDCAMKAYFTGGVEGISAQAVGARPDTFAYPTKNGGDCNSYTTETHLFLINGKNAPEAFSHGLLDVWQAPGTGFSPNGAKPVIVQRWINWKVLSIVWRNSYDGGNTWSVWQYEQPPMVLGTAYPTTRRYKGSIVYTKAVSLGNLPNNTVAEIDPGISYSQMVSLRGIGFKSSNAEGFSFDFGGENTKLQMTSTGKIKVTTAWNGASYSAVAILEYIL